MRFGGTARLYGTDALEALRGAHMVIVGLGGVGCWAAEALARSGVGTLTLIDLDDICITNTNRQLHAMTGQVGRLKTEAMAERLKLINPAITVHAIADFLTKNNLAERIQDQHVVIDAMDSVHIKSALAAYCSRLKIRLITVGSSGGKRDPSAVTIADLARTESDPMLAKMRSQLFRHYNFSRDRGRKFRIDAVFSPEQMVYPKPDGSVCMDKSVLEGSVKLDCASGFGSSAMVTGSYGFTAAARAIERYLERALDSE